MFSNDLTFGMSKIGGELSKELDPTLRKRRVEQGHSAVTARWVLLEPAVCRKARQGALRMAKWRDKFAMLVLSVGIGSGAGQASGWHTVEQVVNNRLAWAVVVGFS